MGLPPLARGARVGLGGGDEDGGPTPACAGSTAGNKNSSAARSAYPRLRGEHYLSTTLPSDDHGLPPLARGAQRTLRTRTPRPRPTPACAGSTTSTLTATPARWAYPRLRGEHTWSAGLNRVPIGLPPLARGAPAAALAGILAPGPTPACAGSTTASTSMRITSLAYPRLRGEHEVHGVPDTGDEGLPPLARGARRGRRRSGARRGPTPACAGSTSSPSSTARTSGAYPRLRGEHRVTVTPVGAFGGLPPLARGARCTSVGRSG